MLHHHGNNVTLDYLFIWIGLSRVEEVEHESSMALLEKERAGENEEEVVETSETYTEEIIYYSPRKSGHYTSKEVGTVLVTGKFLLEIYIYNFLEC